VEAGEKETLSKYGIALAVQPETRPQEKGNCIDRQETRKGESGVL
jgi:hypothetical protein